jgi:hypothetical protein
MSKIFTIIIDDDTFEYVKKELYNRGELEPSVIDKMSDCEIVDASIPFYITHIEEDN